MVRWVGWSVAENYWRRLVKPQQGRLPWLCSFASPPLPRSLYLFTNADLIPVVCSLWTSEAWEAQMSLAWCVTFIIFKVVLDCDRIGTQKQGRNFLKNKLLWLSVNEQNASSLDASDSVLEELFGGGATWCIAWVRQLKPEEAPCNN